MTGEMLPTLQARVQEAENALLAAIRLAGNLAFVPGDVIHAVCDYRDAYIATARPLAVAECRDKAAALAVDGIISAFTLDAALARLPEGT